MHKTFGAFIGDCRALAGTICRHEGIEVHEWDLANVDSFIWYPSVQSDVPVVFVNAYHSLNRQCWSIGHELGHYFLKHPIKHPMPEYHHPRLDRQAHEFAELLFMPRWFMEDMIEKGYTPWEISQRIGLSEEAVSIRYEKVMETMQRTQFEDALNFDAPDADVPF